MRKEGECLDADTMVKRGRVEEGFDRIYGVHA